MHQTRMDLNRRIRRIVILVTDGLRCQPLNVQALCSLQQRWQLRMINADLAAINKLQESLQVARRHAGQHHNWMLACCILRKRSEAENNKNHISVNKSNRCYGWVKKKRRENSAKSEWESSRETKRLQLLRGEHQHHRIVMNLLNVHALAVCTRSAIRKALCVGVENVWGKKKKHIARSENGRRRRTFK